MTQHILALYTLLALVACNQSSQPSTGMAHNAPPRITTFTATPSQGTAPLSVSLRWAASDRNDDPLVCTLDTDANGTPEYTLNPCPRALTQTRAHTYLTGVSQARLTVRDNRGGVATRTLNLRINAPTPPPNPPAPTGLVAFPGAEGFGAQASGGRGGRVIYVTNLNLAGPGSLQAALDQEGARTIVFAVSGVINGPVQLTRGNVTIAGQTSPGGITVRGLMIQGDVVCEEDTAGCVPQVAPENFVVRFLRSRDPAEQVDPSAMAGGDTLRLHRAKKGIIDHVSLGNAYDEAVQISFSSDITLQNTLLAETLGGHAPLGGMLINYSDPTRGFPLTRLSLHRNVWNRVDGRLPEISRENYPTSQGSVMDIEISQNLFYDPAAAIWLSLSCDPSNRTYLGCPIDYRLNMENNLFVGRPGRFSYGMLTLEGGLQPWEGYLPGNSATKVYMRGNRIHLFPTVTDYQLIYCCNDFDQAVRDLGMPYPDPTRPPTFAQANRHPFPEISPVANLMDHAVQQVGMFPRDPMDIRLMGYIASQPSGPDPTNANPAGDALRTVSNPPTPPTDSDLDGMPDTWETARGLNPNQYRPNDTNLSSNPANGIQGCTAGYTNLECYLNELAYLRITGN